MKRGKGEREVEVGGTCRALREVREEGNGTDRVSRRGEPTGQRQWDGIERIDAVDLYSLLSTANVDLSSSVDSLSKGSLRIRSWILRNEQYCSVQC